LLSRNSRPSSTCQSSPAVEDARSFCVHFFDWYNQLREQHARVPTAEFAARPESFVRKPHEPPRRLLWLGSADLTRGVGPVVSSLAWPASGAEVYGEFMNGHRTSPRLDVRNRVAGRLLRLFNPVVRRLISAGLPTGAPNVLLEMRGRRSGRIRSVPVGMLELDGRSFVQASYGEIGWVANLRADDEATVIHPGGRRTPVQAIELSPEEGGAVLRRALRRFRRSRVMRALLGPNFRPPIGVLWRLRIRVDDTLEEYTAEARRHPLFELRPMGIRRRSLA
jgi:deazaflavin-dependent oxidoreductase (nitroreductase family)